MTSSPFDDGADPTTHHRPAAKARPSQPRCAVRLPASDAVPLTLAVQERCLPGADLAERVTFAARNGWSAIGLLRRSVWSYGEERVGELLREHQLSVSSLNWSGGFTGAVGFTYREAIDDGRTAIEEAARLQARCLVIAPGGRGGHTFRHAQRVIVDGLRYLAEVAARRNVPLVVLTAPTQKPFTRWTSIDSLEAAQQLIEKVDSPWVGLSLPLHRWHGHPSATTALRSLSPRIRLVTSPLLTTEPGRLPIVEARLTHLQSMLSALQSTGGSAIWEVDGDIVDRSRALNLDEPHSFAAARFQTVAQAATSTTVGESS